MNFAQYYGDIFSTFGYPLGRNAALGESTVDHAAASLGIALPDAVRDFYLLAGREKRFNQSYNRLLHPREWRVSKNRLIFMEEAQCVVWWGVSLRKTTNGDPPVAQAVNEVVDDALDWYQESPHFSQFIGVMLHLQAVSGGLPHGGVAENVSVQQLISRLKADWNCFGKVNTLVGYSRQNQVISIDDGEDVAVGAKTKRDVKIMQEELGLGNLS